MAVIKLQFKDLERFREILKVSFIERKNRVKEIVAVEKDLK